MRIVNRWPAFAAKSRVPACILFAVAVCWLAQPSPASMLLGVPVGVCGLALRAWAAGHLRKNEQLAASGPYTRVRNPLYLGSLVAAIGLATSANHWLVPAATVAVFAVWILPVVGEEESHLRKILPGFREYETRVSRFIPSITPRIESQVSFDWELYRRNREYSALVPFVALFLILWLKIKFPSFP